MRYEPCDGQCYAEDDVMDLNRFGLDVPAAARLLSRVVQIHDRACGDVNLAYGLDHDEATGVFVASFWRYGNLSLYCDATPLGALERLIDAALAYYASDEYAAKNAERPGLGHDACHHGDDRALVDFALRHSGLSVEQQAEARSLAGV
jgi:hypothetical protein